MTTLWIPNTLETPLQIRKWVANGKLPDADLEATIARHANFAGCWLTQEVARFAQPVTAIPGIGHAYGWRAQWHSSPFAHHLMLRFLVARQDKDAVDPYVRAEVADTSGTVIGRCDYHYGYGTGTATSDVPDEWGTADLLLHDPTIAVLPASIPTDTDLRLTITLSDARLISCVAYELSRPPTTANGYAAQDFGALSPILAADRGDVVEVATGVWKHGAAKLFSYGANTLSTYATNATRNVIDRTSTTVSASTPGYTLDLTERSTKRLSASGVPVVLAVYAAVATANGLVGLKNAAGSLVLSATIPVGTGWTVVTGYLPATVAKYDLVELAGAPGGTITTHAVSLYQYLA